MGERHTKAGGTLYMAAFTFSHKKWHTLLPREGERAHPDFVGPMPAMNGLRDDVTLMWSKMIAGRRWQAMKAAAGVVGIVRALEVTHGKNGWHPHIHALFALDHADDARAAAFGVELFERWDATVQRHGYAACNPAVWRWEKAANYDAAADYVVKGAFDLELTRGHMKLAKGGGRSPWQLLEDAGAGDRRAARLFQEFARAFKGARQVTWSYGLKARYGIDEREDGEITAAEAGEVIGRIPARIYSRIAFKGNCAAVLEAAEDQGWPGVVHLLKGWGLYWVGPPDHFLAGMKGNPRGGRHGQYWAA